MTDDPKTSRVSQNWPVDLKEQVQARVGIRGLTDFTLDAVRQRLAGADLEAQLKEARELAVAAIGELVHVGTDPDVRQIMSNLDPIPEWVSREGWPSFLTDRTLPDPPVIESITPENAGFRLEAVPDEPEVPDVIMGEGDLPPAPADRPIEGERVVDEPVAVVVPDAEGDDERGSTWVLPGDEPLPEAAADQEAVLHRLADQREKDYAERVRQFAERARGEGVDLAPASEIAKPEPKPSTTCPDCFSPLIDGECLACAF